MIEHSRYDCHMHTTFSDGSASVRAMVESAIAKGLSKVAITDHMPTKAIEIVFGLMVLTPFFDDEAVVDFFPVYVQQNSGKDQRKKATLI